MECYRTIDGAIGDAAAELRRRGAYEDTLIVVCSDHGHTPVHTHYDLPVRLEEDFGLRTAYHSRAVFKRDPEAVACVSGNGMAHVYLRGSGWSGPPPARDEIDRRHPGLREGLLAEPGDRPRDHARRRGRRLDREPPRPRAARRAVATASTTSVERRRPLRLAGAAAGDVLAARRSS